jgi:hypothetical protein
VHHPVPGRIKGESAFRQFVAEMNSWLAKRQVDVEHVIFLITRPRGVEEVVLQVEVHAPGSVGADKKSKVFWVQSCVSSGGGDS